MKRNSLTIVLVLFVITTISQEWSEPINISNMEGSDSQPDFTIDQNGAIHCVWKHKITSFFCKIYYSKSEDNGNTWSSPEDISLNDSIWIGRPNIISDSQENLYVSYDYDLYNYNKTLVLLKKFDGESWGEADTVSYNMYSSWNNRLAIDNNDKVYVFWYYGTLNYRVYNDEIGWGDIIAPYPTNDYLFPYEYSIDFDNNIHGIGRFYYSYQFEDDARYVYFKYNAQTNNWTDIEFISNPSGAGGSDIACDELNNPHVVRRQKTVSTGPDNDSTMYRYFDGNVWTEPELIVEDPYSQKIGIIGNEVYIIDWEKDGDYGNVVFYEQDDNNNWIGEIIVNAEVVNPESFLTSVNFLHLLLSGKVSSSNVEIYYMNKEVDTATNIKEMLHPLKDVKFFPNPFNDKVNILYETLTEERNRINIYSISGESIKVLKDKTEAPGKYEICWDGTDNIGKRVAPGYYLIRVFSGKYVWTRSVEYVH